MAARRTTQLAALAKTVKALKAGGQLGDEHAALIAVAEGVARQIDDGSGKTTDSGGDVITAALWKEYRAAVVALVEVGAVDSDGTADAVIALLRPAMGDAANS